jgi:arylsulfatase A
MLRALLAVAALGTAQRLNGAPPNVVLIMADDFGYECVRANGGTSYQTPNLDKLAAEGVRFTRAYATPLCTPSRTQIMTGRYNSRNYVRFGEFDFKERTFAHVLKDAGYGTTIVGKWQLGTTFDGPAKAGFDDYILWNFGEQVKGSRYMNPALVRNGRVVTDAKGRYGPDLFCDHLCGFVTANKSKPFLAYWPMVLTHAPFERTPDAPGGRPAEGTANFPDMVAYLDKNVGRLVAHLENEGVRDNTLILFTGDNGTGKPIRSVLDGRPVQGGKGTTTARGTHTPLIANWPAGGAKGQVCDDLIDFTDVLPTLLEAAGAGPPAGVTLDGRSFLPQVRGQAGNPRDSIFCHYEPRHGANNPKTRYAQDKRWKLYQDGKLYDLTADPDEKTPVPGDAAARKKLQAVLDRMEAETPFATSPPPPPGAKK